MKRVPDEIGCDLLLAATAQALACLAQPQLDDERVHAARKALKSARGALRLLRPRLGEAAYARENVALRDAARELSPLRDARSLLGSLDLLGRRQRRRKPVKAALARLRPVLQVRLRQAHDDLVANPAARRRCADLVRGCRERTRHALTGPADAQALHEGFRRIYRKARTAYLQAAQAPTAEALHEWRKQTKYLLTTASALGAAGVNGLRRTTKRADRIAERLGDDHDLGVLDGALSDFAGDTDAAVLRAPIDRRRARLQRRALRDGARLFARKPKRFAARAAKSLPASMPAPARVTAAPSTQPAAPAIHCRAPSARRTRAGAGRRPA